MSITNTLKEVMFAIQSTDFMTKCDSYDEMNRRKDENTLFKMEQNQDFVALSKLVLEDGVRLNVNWYTDTQEKPSVKTWMFSGGNCSDAKLLKAFIRTQIYRPLFFKYNNYVNFTDTGNEQVYSCTTTKWYCDHEGNPPKRIVFQNGTWPDDPKVDKHGSGLDDVPNVYAITDANYFKVSNKFEYHIEYAPVDIVDDKFVVNDVEFYVVRPNGGNNDPVNSIYFNEFQNNTEGQNQVAKVDGGKFKLDGIEYVIVGDEIRIDKIDKPDGSGQDDATFA